MCMAASYMFLSFFLILIDTKSTLFWYLEKIFIIASLLLFGVSSYLFYKSFFVSIDEFDF